MWLSIITVCYNSELTIEKTIKSVISQKTEEIEYIIVDGASTDHTIDIVNKYRDDIDIIISEKDSGISDAFNKGIKAANGELIGIINSDDWYLPNCFTLLKQSIRTDTDVFFGNGIRVYPDGKHKDYMSNPDSMELHNCMDIVHPSTFVRKAAYHKYGYFDINYKYVMDRECLLRMLNGGACFQYDEGFYSAYRMGGKSDKSYLMGVVPESFKIDIKDGKKLLYAVLNCLKRCIVYLLLRIRDFIFRM